MFFRVDLVVAEGNARYSDSELIAASGIRQGDNLVLLNKYGVKQAVFAELPYIETISIQRKYPDTIVLSVTECAAAAALPGGDGMWWLISEQGKLLDASLEAPTDCTIVTGCTLVSPASGAQAALSEEESYKLEYLRAFLQAAEKNQLLSEIGGIDLGDGTRITFTYQDRFTVYTPWDGDMDRALRAVQKVVSEKLESNEKGEINLMNLMSEGRAYFIPQS